MHIAQQTLIAYTSQTSADHCRIEVAASHSHFLVNIISQGFLYIDLRAILHSKAKQ